MAYQALYRKYRPATFNDVVGQEHITETLKNQLDSGKIFHAYLFTGTRGTGKTSCAKILAKAVNCLSPVNGDPCGKCDACNAFAEGENTDISEIDAASNNGVDDIRSLRDSVNFAPANSKYRVYIIDEVHMLTESAFNALLKTLEEPPPHIIFILATTEVHKLPATILSRCQRFDFHRIDSSVICNRLQYVAKEEGLTLTESAASLIASAADGGMRDALSILDLCVSGGEIIDEEVVSSACGMAGKDYLIKLADSIKSKNVSDALLLLDQLYNHSVDMLRLLNELTGHFRDLMIVKTVSGEQKPIICSPAHLEALSLQAYDYPLSSIMNTLKILREVYPAMQSGNRRLQMEMALIRLCSKEGLPSSDIEERLSVLERKLEGTIEVPVKKQIIKEEKNVKEEVIAPINETEKEPSLVIEDGILECWEEIVKDVCAACPMAISVLKDSCAYIDGSFLLIDAKNHLFRSMMNSNAIMRDTIKTCVKNKLGKSFRLGPYNKQEKGKNNQSDPLLSIAQKLKETDLNK